MPESRITSIVGEHLFTRGAMNLILFALFFVKRKTFSHHVAELCPVHFRSKQFRNNFHPRQC